MKKVLALLLVAVIIFDSCHKDLDGVNNLNLSKISNSQQSPSAPVISNEALANWFVKNPVGQHLKVNWAKAKQITLGHVAVVTVPVTGISQTAVSGNKKTNDVNSASTVTTLTTFDPYHPPALYFFQDKTSATPDSVKGLLMNFAPDDSTKEDGARKIWTGKLIEWNMQGSTAYIQHLTKSKVDGKFSANLNSTSSTNTNSSKSINSVSSKQISATKTNTLFDWLDDLWDSICSFFSGVGYLLGIDGSVSFDGTMIINGPCAFLWGLFCGGGGSISGTDDAGDSYNIIYSSYVTGYNGYDAAANTNWSAYITTPSVGSGDNPCTPQAVKGKTVQQLQGGCSADGTTYVITPAMTINAFAVFYNLTSDQQQLLNSHPSYFYAISGFITGDPYLNGNWLDAADFINYSIDNLSYNLMSANDYISQFDPAVAGFDIDAPYTPDPANAYVLDISTIQNYPRFTKLVNQLPQYLSANPSVLAAIMAYTGYSSAHIMQMVQPGQGPTIRLQTMDPNEVGDYTPGNPPTIANPDYFYVNTVFVDQLEHANYSQTQQAIAFLLAVTIFHETVHYGRAMNNLSDPSPQPDNGVKFENMAFKVHVTADNANQVYNYKFLLQ